MTIFVICVGSSLLSKAMDVTDALHNIQMCCVQSEEIVQLFIYEWKVDTQQLVRLVYQKKMVTSHDKMK